MPPLFNDRAAAGRALAAELRGYAARPDVVVLALPPRGVPVARELARALGVPMDLLIAGEPVELIRARALYGGSAQPVSVAGRTVIVVDDGIVTGHSMRVALKALRPARPDWIVVAVPVAPPQAQDLIGTAADEFACVEHVAELDDVGRCYRHFAVPTDEDVRRLLERPGPDAEAAG